MTQSTLQPLYRRRSRPIGSLSLNGLCRSPVLAAFLASSVMAQTAAPVAPHPNETPFLAANEVAMDKMMNGMSVRPTGDVDADFTAMMIPHHQGAIDMAVTELRFGHNETLRRIAQEIIVDQQGEIAAMRLALGQTLPPSAPAPTGGVASPNKMTMQMELAR